GTRRTVTPLLRSGRGPAGGRTSRGGRARREHRTADPPPAHRRHPRRSAMTSPLPDARPVGQHRVAVSTSAAPLPGQAATLLADGYRLALVAAHDDGSAL